MTLLPPKTYLLREDDGSIAGAFCTGFGPAGTPESAVVMLAEPEADTTENRAMLLVNLGELWERAIT